MTDTRKVVLLTGATGHMGREALRQFEAKRDTIRLRILVRPEERDHPVVQRALSKNSAEIAWGDLCDRESIEAAVAGVEIVLHVGGLVSPLADNLPPEVVNRVNVGGARNIVDAIKRVGDPLRTKLVYIGTVAQTGSRNEPIHWGRTGDPIKLSAFDHYAVTKTQAEAIVAESGIAHWVSLRQSGMAHYEMYRTFDPIIFHNPINGVFEWSTAVDSGRLMLAVCADDVPAHFWRAFYNIGGGRSSRLVNHEFMAASTPNFRKIMKPHWFATRNFHGQWYSDSDRLHELVPFRAQSIVDYLREAPRHKPLVVRAVPRIAPILVRHRLESLANGPGGSLRWFKDNDLPKIRAYFGSRSQWGSIPRTWEDFEFRKPSPEVSLLNHGYDERRLPSHWTASDLSEAAAFRGGQCKVGHSADPFERVEWECAFGHRFQMSPTLVLKGGHWCDTCQYQPLKYSSIASRNPFFDQVWTEEN